MKFDTAKYTRDLKKYYQIPAVQSSLTVVLSIFVIAIFISMALRPTLISITNLKGTITDANKTSQTLKAKVKTLQTASSQLELIKPLLPKLNENIPSKGVMYGDLVNTIEALAIQSGVKLDTESLGASLLFSRLDSPFHDDKNHEVVALKYNVSVTGTYPQLDQFLNSFLQMERLAMVDSINITPIGAGRNNAKKTETGLKLDVMGSVFYIADEQLILNILGEKKGGK